jgi:hypothetical protein
MAAGSSDSQIAGTGSSDTQIPGSGEGTHDSMVAEENRTPVPDNSKVETGDSQRIEVTTVGTPVRQAMSPPDSHQTDSETNGPIIQTAENSDKIHELQSRHEFAPSNSVGSGETKENAKNSDEIHELQTRQESAQPESVNSRETKESTEIRKTPSTAEEIKKTSSSPEDADSGIHPTAEDPGVLPTEDNWRAADINTANDEQASRDDDVTEEAPRAPEIPAPKTDPKWKHWKHWKHFRWEISFLCITSLWSALTAAYAYSASSPSRTIFSNPNSSVLVLGFLGTATAYLLHECVSNACNGLRWTLAANPKGVEIGTFLALAPRIGTMGLFHLAFSTQGGFHLAFWKKGEHKFHELWQCVQRPEFWWCFQRFVSH